MDYIKNSLGYGAQSGQEPVSGEVGKGTPDQPYDAGNVAGQSGAPAAEATSTNPTGTTQYDTGGTYLNYGAQSGQEPISGEMGKGTPYQPYDAGNVTSQSGAPGTTQYDTGAAGERTGPDASNAGTSQFDTGETPKTNATDSNTRESGGLNTTENLAAGVTGGDPDAASGKNNSTADAASKGTDESRGPDEEVRSNQSAPVTDSQTNAQDTFYQKAHLDKDKPAASPKVPDEITNKDPFESSSGANDTSTETAANTQRDTQSATAPTSSTEDNSTLGAGGSEMSPEKNYRTADTEPHPESSEVLSSATPGAALGSTSETIHQPSSEPTGQSSYETPTQSTNEYSSTQPSDTTATTGATNPSTTNESSTVPATTSTRAAADTDYPSPKTQPSESQGGLSGISHNTGKAPAAPDTGSDAVEDPALGASQGQGPNKKKMGDRIKEKLHLGKKSSE